jgi:hypothetical protein
VLDAVEVALEAQAERVGLLESRADARADRPGRAGREAHIELLLTVFPPLHAAPDVPLGFRVRAPHDDVAAEVLHHDLGHLMIHGSRVPVG